MTRYLLLSYFCLLSLSGFTQGDHLIKLRYWNGLTDGAKISHPIGLEVSATELFLTNQFVRVNEATLLGALPSFYLKRKFVLFFTVQNVSKKDIAIYDWAFKAVCPVDNMGRKFDATSMVQLTTPYIPGNIYIILKPGEQKQFYSAETDFSECIPQDKNDLAYSPKYFQALITCASIAGSPVASKIGQKPGSFQSSTSLPQKPRSDLDPQFDQIIKEHNELIRKNENESAELLKRQLLKITNIAYPTQVNLIESKLMKPLPSSSVGVSSVSKEKGTLSFNGRAIEADGDCMESTASLTSNDESSLLILNNLGSSGTFSVNANFYTNACMDCLAVQYQDITNARTYIAVDGTVNRTAQGITIDVTMKDMLSILEGGTSGYRVTGRIVCE